MKHRLLILSLFGFICGAVIGGISTAFVPRCGDPCGVERFGVIMLWGIGCLFSFPCIAWFVLRRAENTRKNFILTTCILAIVPTGIATFNYGYQLHTRYWANGGPLDVPNLDFSAIVIATKPVSVSVYGKSESVLVKAWERCAIGIASCSEKPRTVEAICFDSRSTVMIEERNWTSFQRIPEEDLRGVTGLPKSMNFCTNDL